MGVWAWERINGNVPVRAGVGGLVVGQMKQNKRIAVHHTRALQEQERRIQAERDSKMKSAFLSNMSQYAGDKGA
jgi:hypothetical protein